MCIALDARELRTLAPEHVLRRGLLHFRRRQVASLRATDTGIDAQVLGAAPGEGYEVQVRQVGDRITTACSCEEQGACPHAIAALLAAQPDGEGLVLLDAVARAAQARLRSSREVELRPLSVARGLGRYEARTIGSGRAYEVALDALDQLGGSCTCPDFRTNELGTCKHLEAARREAARARGRALPRVPLYRHVELAPREQGPLSQPVDFRVIPGLRARLHPYQREGVAFLVARGRAVLADDMGLGKTVQAIAAACWLQAERGLERTLIVCPASLKHQWAREIRRFTDAEVQVVQGSPSARRAQWGSGAAFTIANYELVRRDLSVLQRELDPQLLILDEAQRIKNWNTLTAAAIKRIDSRYAFLLTGTPLENRLEDLYSLLQLIDPRVLGPLWRFRHEHQVAGDASTPASVQGLSDLRRRLSAVVLRRDRSLVADQLPACQRIRRDVPLTERQKELHDEATASAARLAAIQKRRPLSFFEERRLMMFLQRARMACNAAFLVDKDDARRGSPKLDALRELLTELCVESDRKVVVFSEWERMTALAEDVVRGLGIGFARLHGGVPSGARGALLRRFTEDSACRVFLSTDAGGVGLNLQAGQVLVNLDLPFNPARLEQRIARIHRLGQPEPTRVILLVAQDSYEERVWAGIEGKRELFVQTLHADADQDIVELGSRVKELVQILDLGVVEPAAPTLEQRVAEHFGRRLRVLVRAKEGVLAGVEGVTAQDLAWCEAIEGPTAVGCVDPAALPSLRRLGLVSEELWTAPEPASRRRIGEARDALDEGNPRRALELVRLGLEEHLAEGAPIDEGRVSDLIGELARLVG